MQPAGEILKCHLAGAPPRPKGLGSQLGELLPVPPIVPFSSPWLPEMSRQHQELQRQAAAHSQRLEAKVKSLQEELGRAPDTHPLLLGWGRVLSRAAKHISGGRNGRWEPFALHSRS